MRTVPLRVSQVGFLDANGNLTLSIGPLSAGEIWHPDTAHVNVNQGATNEATCYIYVGEPSNMSYRDSTSSGSFGDSTGRVSGDVIKCGQYVWAVWSGGDAEQQATLTVVGTRDVL